MVLTWFFATTFKNASELLEMTMFKYVVILATTLGVTACGGSNEKVTSSDIDYFPYTKPSWYLTAVISYKNYSPFVINFSSQNPSSFAANQEYFVRLVRGGQ